MKATRSEKPLIAESLIGIGSYSYGWNLVARDATSLNASGNLRKISVARLHDTTNMLVVVCGGGYAHGGRRVIFQQAPTLAGTRFDTASMWHLAASKQNSTRTSDGVNAGVGLFVDGHAARFNVDPAHKISNSGDTDSVIDRFIRVAPFVTASTPYPRY